MLTQAFRITASGPSYFRRLSKVKGPESNARHYPKLVTCQNDRFNRVNHPASRFVVCTTSYSTSTNANKLQSKPATDNVASKPSTALKKVYIPGFVKATQLAAILNTKLQTVVKFARQNKYKFKKHSEIILDWHHSRELAVKLGFDPEYYEVDATREEDWIRQSNPANPSRPVVISVLGHVDHGKTTLLDVLSNSDVAASEPGKITQAVSAFMINLGRPESQKQTEEEMQSPYTYLLTSFWNKNNVTQPVTAADAATFLDTPGHAAFFKMREGGASVADFVMLIIDANEGIREQTIESIKLIKMMRIPILVVINKIDISSDAMIEKVYRQLHKLKLCVPGLTRASNPLRATQPQPEKMFKYIAEDFPVMAICEISALKRRNIDILKVAIRTLASGLSDSTRPDIVLPKSPAPDIQAFSYVRAKLGSQPKPAVSTAPTGPKVRKPVVPKPTAEATVIESWLSAAEGKTLLAIVHRGVLVAGETFVTDRFIGRIRSMHVSDVRYLDPSARSPSGAKEIKYSLPGMPVLLNVTLESKFNVAGAETGLPPTSVALYQFSKNDAEEVHDYRNLVMEYKTKEISGRLFVTPEEAAAGEEDAEADEDLMKEADVIPSLQVDSSKNPQVSPLTSKSAAKILKDADSNSVSYERSLAVVIRADNIGRLEGLTAAAKVVAMQQKVSLRILRSGVGEITPTDLWIAQVAVEENNEDKVHFLCLNTNLGSSAKQWLEKNKRLPFTRQFSFATHNVFLDIIQVIKDEIKMKYPDIVTEESDASPEVRVVKIRLKRKLTKRRTSAKKPKREDQTTQ